MPQRRFTSTSIAIGGISHETHAFADEVTTLADFEQRALLSGGQLVENARGSDGVLGGIVDAIRDGVQLVPTLFASAMPGGPVHHDAWEDLARNLLTRLRTAAIRPPGLDGVILALHGAMQTTEDTDPDGTLVHMVRESLGDAIPIVVVLDSHGTPSDRMLRAADAILAYRTYPHVDTHATGASALAMCLRLALGEAQPHTAVRRLPVLVPLTAQRTNGPTPMARLARQAAALERLPAVLQAHLLPGFPFHDAPHTGATVIVTTDNDRDHAESLAGRFAEGAWQFLRSLPSMAVSPDTLRLPVLQTSGKPAVFADVSDNPGAGAPGDNTTLLAHALEQGWVPGVVATICDPAAVEAAYAAGPGGVLDEAIGGKASDRSGDPVPGPWRVHALGDGVVRNVGPMGRGGTSRFGRTAAVRRDGITVILSSQRQQVLDPAIIHAHQIEPSLRHWIAVKSAVHFRAAFEPFAAQVVEVDTGGLATELPNQFAYHHVQRPIIPLDPLNDVTRARASMIKVESDV